MISLFYIFLLVLSVAILLPVMNLVAEPYLVTSGLVIDPDFNSWTCYKCWSKIEDDDKEALTNKARSHMRSKHSFLGKYLKN